MKTIRIGTRKSQLALWQAHCVADALRKHHPGIEVELVEIVSEGDKTLDVPLSKVGGKGLFLKELERAILDGKTDIAVHSMKDVTVELPEGLHIPAVFPREDPRDAFVSTKFKQLGDMPPGSTVGTCSLRRQCQIKAAFPELELVNLRGNVNTRLSRLDHGDFDAIILAVAGLKRLNMGHRIAQTISPEICLPAIGQGIIGVECRIDDDEINELIQPLKDQHSWVEIQCERIANRKLGGGCHVPVALFCEMNQESLRFRALVGTPDGSTIVKSDLTEKVENHLQLGTEVADDLLAQGAGDILASVYNLV